MKKYSKPMVFIENLKTAAVITAACNSNEYTSADEYHCAIDVGLGGPVFNNPDICFFTGDEYVCYHNPDGATTILFTS